MLEDFEHRYRAVLGRDLRFGGWFYVDMRALGDPDAFLPTDLGVRRAVERLGRAGDLRSITELAERWRPWCGYATKHLWANLAAEGVRTNKREVVA